MTLRISNLLAFFLLIMGMSAMAGHVLNLPKLKGLGLAYCAAPYTKVFCEATSLKDGKKFETFASGFVLDYAAADGTRVNLKITPEIYQQLRGPYNRRNVYGAVLAYGPALPEKMHSQMMYYALVDPGLLSKELGLPDDAHDFHVVITSHTFESNEKWILTPKQ